MSQLLRHNDKQFLNDMKIARKVFVYAPENNRSFHVSKISVYHEAASSKIKYKMFKDADGKPNMLIL